jgi:hypothetical protein
MLEGRPVAPDLRAPLQLLDRVRGLRRHRAQKVEVLVARPAAGDRLVDREDAEQPALGMCQRDEQAVVGIPRVRRVAHGSRRREARQLDALPVDLGVVHEIGAAVQEALLEQRRPVVPRARRPEQRALRLGVPVHGGDLEVVPRGAVEVDHDRLPAEARRDRRGDRVEQLLELALAANEVRELEQGPDLRKRRGAVLREPQRRGR